MAKKLPKNIYYHPQGYYYYSKMIKGRKFFKAGFSTPEDAETELHLLLYKVGSGQTKIKVTKNKFDTVIKTFIKNLSNEYSLQVSQKYKLFITANIVPVFKSKNVCDITNVDLYYYITNINKSNSRKDYAKRLMSKLLKFLIPYGLSSDVNIDLVNDLVVPPKVYIPRSKVFSSEDIKNVLNNIEEPIFKLAFITFIIYGVRMSELRALIHDHIDIENNTIAFDDQLQAGVGLGKSVLTGKTKSKKERVYTISKVFLNLYQSIEFSKSSPFIFFNEKTKVVFGATTFNRKFKEALKKVGLQDASVHALRKSCGTLLAKNGVNEYLLTDYMGHEDVKTTKKHYIIYQAKDKEELVNFMDGIFE